MQSITGLVKIWESASADADPVVRDRIWAKIRKSIRRSEAARRVRIASVSFAAAAAMFALGFFISGTGKAPVAPQAPETEWIVADNGGQMLPDGSLVWLESGSRLSFAGGMKDGRSVTLDGDATFDIVHMPDNSPFFVNIKGSRVKVTGTKFSVRMKDEDIVDVTLFDGAVEFLPGDDEKGLSIKPMQTLIFNLGSGESSTRNLFSNIYWADGQYKLENADLKELVSFMSWRYGVSVSFRNVKDNVQKFNGCIAHNESIESVIDKVCYVLKLRHREDGSVYCLYK